MKNNRRSLLAAIAILAAGAPNGLRAQAMQPVKPLSQGPMAAAGRRPRRWRTLTGGGLIGVAIAAAVLWIMSKPKK